MPEKQPEEGRSLTSLEAIGSPQGGREACAREPHTHPVTGILRLRLQKHC